MKVSNKTNIIVGIILLLLAAFFSISLILQPLDFGQFGPGKANFLFRLGEMLVSVYGFTSIFIPVFLFASAISCFATNWTARRSMRLLTAIIPFFTIFGAEKLIRAFLDGGNFTTLKIIVTSIVAVMLVIIEFLLAGIAADKISSSDSYKLDKVEKNKPKKIDENDNFKYETNKSEKNYDSYDDYKLARFYQEQNEKNGRENSIDDDLNDSDKEKISALTKFKNLFKSKNEKEIENNEDEFKEESGDEKTENSEENESKKGKTEFDSNNVDSENYLENQNDENETSKKEDPFAGVFDDLNSENDELPENLKTDSENGDEIYQKPEDIFKNKRNSFQENHDDSKTSDSDSSSDSDDSFETNPASLITKEEFDALTNFGDDDENDSENDDLEWPSENEIKEKAGNKSGDISDFEENPDDEESPFGIFEDSENQHDENDSSENDENALNIPEETDISENQDENFNDDSKKKLDEANDDFSDDEIIDDELEEDQEIPIFAQVDEQKDDTKTLDNDFEDSFNDYENIISEEKNEPNLNSDFFDIDPNKDYDEETENSDLKKSAENFDEPILNPNENYLTPDEVLEKQKIEDENRETSLSSNVFKDMENDIRKEVKAEMLQKKYAQEENSNTTKNFAESAEFSDNEENLNGENKFHENENSIASTNSNVNQENANYESHRAMPKKPYFVPTTLLEKYDDDKYWIIDDETKQNAVKLKTTLTDFGISAEIIGIKKGPVVTMYELEPAPGVRLSKIVSLQDNIALSLAASSVRIVAPIPGRAAVGIEVPNKVRSIVSFREMIEQDLPEFKKMAIPVVLGKDILGKSQIIDIAKTPHLLIAGATGAGKSVCVNSIILSILYKRSPQQVKLILVDPKVVELKLYNDIPHLLTPVITEPKRALQSLQWCLCEMERRYALLEQMGARNITDYNARIEERNICTEKLPYIVVIIDEFADLMATSGKELETNVARLAAMSRAVGIHLVLATQRPSVNVITGLIKANIPSRIAFMVTSRTDSNIIIDAIGAEKLLGKGDMLYVSASTGSAYPVRIQGTFESDSDVEKVVDYVKTLGEPDYIDDQMFFDDDEEDNSPSLFSEGAEDPLYEQALDIVIQAGKASASYIQRRLKIGYNRAARLVEEMEERGIVGPANGSKPREIIHVPN